MIDDNPLEASTPAVVPDMSPDELVFGRAPPTLFEPPSVMDPVSNLDFLPVDDAFALEMRSETIEQLVGGDALRRGESERIEAGRSQTNADRVAGRDRVRMQGALREHTGHGLNEQATHLHITVDGTLDVHAASEDTVLLAGHMRDLWDGGTAIVAAMADDTVGGGGIRVTTPLDLWVHGLMGVEERIGTCTADAVLLELGATHYEREYGPGAHAAGLASYTGSLYQSNRSTFRALMRVSSGVRNLIAGGGGEGGGGNAGAGGAPVASPPPVPAAGGAGTQAACATLSAATGAGGTAQAGVVAGVRSEDLAGIHRVDEVAALARGANVAGACGDLTGLRRGTDTAGQLAALRHAMRGGEAGTQGAVTSLSRVSKRGHPSRRASPRKGWFVFHSAVSPQRPPRGVEIGSLGGVDDPLRPARSEFELWKSIYWKLRAERVRHLGNFNWVAIRAIDDAISRIDAKLIEVYAELGGSIDALKWNEWDNPLAEVVYRAVVDMARQAATARNFDGARAIEQFLASVDRLTVELIHELDARFVELHGAWVEARRIMSLDPCIDVQKVTDWIQEQIDVTLRRMDDAISSDDEVTRETEWHAHRFYVRARSDVKAGHDPRVGSYHRIRDAFGPYFFGYVESDKPLLVRLLEAMADPSMHRLAVQGSEAGGATPPPFRTLDSGAAVRPGEISRAPGHSSSATAGTDAGDLGRGMLDQPVVGPADEAHPGTTAPRSGDAQAMATPDLGAQATFWLRPVDPVPAPGTVRFDAGLQRAGQQPQHSGEAAMGGTAVRRPFVPTPEEMLDTSHLTYMPSWSQDAFAIERDLIAGRLPERFEPLGLKRQWRGLAAASEFEALLERGLLPTRAIDSEIERLRAVEGGRDHIVLIQQLEAMKQSIDRALTNQFGSRADADWVAKVDEYLQFGSAAQAVGVESISVPGRGEDIVEGLRSSLQQLRIESAAPPGPTEWGARELSPGAWSPAQDPWGSPWSRDGSDAAELSPGAMSPAQRPLSPWSQDGSSAGELSPGALSPAQDPWGSPWSRDGSDAGELSPGALSPVEDPLSPRPQVRVGEDDVVRFEATQPVSSLGAGDRGIAVGPTGGWQAAETPGFGRLASISAELAFSRREQIVHRLMTGEPLAVAQRSELIGRYERAIRAGMIASPAPRARTAAALLEDLRQLSTAVRVSPVTALHSPALDDIDWAAIELMLRLFDSPGL